MIWPKIYIVSIERLLSVFQHDCTLSYKENIRRIERLFLICKLKSLGLSFDYHINTNANGKPYFVNNDKIHFSFSNTKEYIALAINSPSQIGIDIEPIQKNKYALSQRFFSQKENEYLLSCEHEFDMAFTQLWTKKEAFIKKQGTTIANNFKSISLNNTQFSFKENYLFNNNRIISYFDINHLVFVSICY